MRNSNTNIENNKILYLINTDLTEKILENESMYSCLSYEWIIMKLCQYRASIIKTKHMITLFNNSTTINNNSTDTIVVIIVLILIFLIIILIATEQFKY